jgi:tetratricopeptide (TPR) repeat protein
MVSLFGCGSAVLRHQPYGTLTVLHSRRRILFMKRRFQGAWLVLAGIVVASPLIGAQGPEKADPSSVDPDWTYSSPGPAKCVEIGNVYLHKGSLQGALSRFQEALKDNPHYAPAYLGLGKVYERMKQNQKALAAYKRYLDELPSAKQAADARDARRAIAHLEGHQ